MPTLRERLTGGPRRVVGLDVARGLAVLGMFTAHVGVVDVDEATLWLTVVDGRSSVLFALVAGVSLALVTGGARPLTGDALVHARGRLLVRAALLLVVVALLDLLGTRILLILGFYAAYFVLALPFLTWGPRRLAALAVVVAVVGPPLALWGPVALVRAGLHLPDDGSGAVTDFVLTGHYPAVVWMAYVFAGMAIGRCDLSSSALRTRLLVGGLAATVVGYGFSVGVYSDPTREAAVRDQVSATSGTGAWSAPWPTPFYLALPGPHEESWTEVLGSGGFAVAVVAACLFAGRVGAVVLAPLAAVGSMALTAYSLQVVAVWYWDLLDAESNGPLVLMTVVTLVAATAWRAAWRRGPLERLFTAVAVRAAPAPTADRPAA
ncbi:hypothetical protein GCM10023216_29990 [Isoptericola chiayiensis]|uniref:Heparan-alpha-glucosaminide N-acetyltransferase catalytic domain-containing protein n=1 Tax=Isoptericola chiayiensis TaxID=579446 RepID=A0ABP8YSD8_9MICO|nr:heparan-alpha-glucosaminide N-acetyltransferase domain-containing protein [Isoptericola chiayiensis]NOW01845.1 putative membrane protein YeiB [Isoptericola chiayiensis]